MDLLSDIFFIVSLENKKLSFINTTVYQEDKSYNLKYFFFILIDKS